MLWESFGTDVIPNVGDLVKNAVYSDGYITFQTADTFKEGNAVIAAKDAFGNILWSWHIWLTDEPEGQEYYNNAGTMMDRNLGATSATPGDVGALGLLYQWGRKDPFLGSSSISSSIEAESTLTWPLPVKSDILTGTIEYTIKNPTVFITKNNNVNQDWYYTGNSFTDETRWESIKTIYDPCPVGWCIPSGESIWAKAIGSASPIYNSDAYNSAYRGYDMSGKLGDDSEIWYPITGWKYYLDSNLENVAQCCWYWSGFTDNIVATTLYLDNMQQIRPSDMSNFAYGMSVRCVQE